MIPCAYVPTDASPREPAYNRHNRLKKTEMKAEAEYMPEGDMAKENTARNGHGESIHGQPHGNPEDFEKIHMNLTGFCGVKDKTSGGIFQPLKTA
ncbi:MAG: hypothetical protein LRY51_04715 [Geovibrio sp.]|nr:hypothetical protein [Geovibrio sp.]